MGLRVLIIHPGWFVGAKLCRELCASSDVEYVAAVDADLPGCDLGPVDFIRADVRRPVLLRIVEAAQADTVVHLGLYSTAAQAGGRAMMHDLNVLGSMHLLAACQKASSVHNVIVRSSTAVYGAEPNDPAVLAEDMERSQPGDPFGRDCYELEDHVLGLRRTRPDIDVTVFRFSNILGPESDTPVAHFLSRRVAPTRLGFDPRVQFLHQDDAVSILEQAVLRPVAGTFNATPGDAVFLSQALRLGGRVGLPMPAAALRALQPFARIVDRTFEVPPHVIGMLSWGRVAGNSRLRESFGYTPSYDSRATLMDFYAALRLRDPQGRPGPAPGADREVDEFVQRMTRP